jgi:hypothetical protein
MGTDFAGTDYDYSHVPSSLPIPTKVGRHSLIFVAMAGVDAA